MDLNDMTTMLRRGWWIVLLLAALGGCAARSYAQGQPAKYSSTSQAYVVVNNSGTSGGDTFNAGQAAQGRMASYAALATSPVVAQGVAEALKVTLDEGDVAGHLSASFAPGTLLLEITATGHTARQASDLAAETTRQLAKQVEILETPAPGVPPWARVLPIVEATQPQASKPNSTKLAGVGAAGGFGLGCALVFLMVRLDPRVRTRAGIATVFSSDPVAEDDSRAVRSRVFAAKSSSPFVAVSGVWADSWPTTRRLAEAIAATGASVLVFDASDALAGATKAHGLGDADGLAELLRLRTDGQDLMDSADPRVRRVVRTAGGPVTVIPSGTGRADLPDLLAAPEAAEVLAQAASGYDYALVDGARPSGSAWAGGATRLFVVELGTASAQSYWSEIGPGKTSGESRVVVVARRRTALRRLAAVLRGAARAVRGGAKR